MLIFLDDSGDPGFKVKKGSSPCFVIALAIFDDHLEARVNAKTVGIVTCPSCRTTFRYDPERNEKWDVTVQSHGKDRYQHTIGDVILPDGMNLNQELVTQRWCWWYRKYAPGDTVLEGLEKDAREGRKGLWADPHPVPPWEGGSGVRW